MAKKKADGAHGGGHGWFVTFADLMGLLMRFFVMLVRVLHPGPAEAADRRRFDARRLRRAEQRPLFGHHRGRRAADAAEAEECRPYPAGGGLGQSLARTSMTATAPAARGSKEDRAFALAAASLRQALQDMPEITEVSKTHHDRGDQGRAEHRNRRPGRPLDVSGRHRRNLTSGHANCSQKLAIPLKITPYRVSDHRPYIGVAGAAASGLWAVGACRPIAPMWCGRFSKRKAYRPAKFYHGCRPRRHTAFVSGRSVIWPPTVG